MHVDSIDVKAGNLLEMIDMIHDGLPIDAFYRLRQKLDLSEKEFCEVINMSKRTLTRRKQEGRLAFAESERVLRLARLLDKAVEAFGDNEGLAARWFKSPARGLGGKSPLEFAQTEIGSQEVYALLVRIEHGVFPG